MEFASFASFLMVVFFVFGIIAGSFHKRTEQSLLASMVFIIVLYLLGQPSFLVMYSLGALAGYLLYAYFSSRKSIVGREKKETIKL